MSEKPRERVRDLLVKVEEVSLAVGRLADVNGVLLKALKDVRDNVRGDSPDMWKRVDAAIALAEGVTP